MNAWGQRGIFDELEQIVLEHHLPCGRCHIAAHLENRFIGLRQAALFQVAQPVVHSGAQTFALRLDGLGERLGIERQKVGGRRCIDPLLHREPQLLARRFVGLHAVGQIEQRTRAQQVERRGVA